MTTAVSIIIGIVIFCLLVVFHEFGHLLLAKKNGIDVPEFSIGFGPRLFGFKKNGTDYCVRLLPLGGSCRMLGEESDFDAENSFAKKSIGARFSTILAGPLFNFILAFVVAIIVIGIVGYDPCVVTGVYKYSAADEAGIQAGDIITSFDGKSISISRELMIYNELNNLTDEAVEVSYERDGVEYDTILAPKEKFVLGFTYRANDEPCSVTVSEGGAMANAGIKAGDIITEIDGVAITSGLVMYEYVNEHPFDGRTVSIKVNRDGQELTFASIVPIQDGYSAGFGFSQNVRVKTSPLKVLKYSVVEVKYNIENVITGLKLLITGKASRDDFGGPVKIVSYISDTVKETKDDGILYVIVNLLQWTILLSANLGVMNLLPIPALDGGRLLFIIIELFTKKPIPPEKEGIVNGICFILLIILMIFIFYNDIRWLILR